MMLRISAAVWALLCVANFARELPGSANAGRTLNAAFDIWAGPEGCKQAPKGVSFVNGFPSSPFLMSRSQLFSQAFRNPSSPKLNGPVTNSEDYRIKMSYYEIDIAEDLVDLGIKQCQDAKAFTPMLRYGGQFPGPLIQAMVGEQTTIRFTNKISPNSFYFPETSASWGPGSHILNACKERQERTGNPNPGRGRATTVHHHGMPSLAPFDGWAEDLSCFGDSKNYVLSHDFASSFWYHDHALGSTSENTYAGLEGMHIVHPCKEPYGMTGIPIHTLQFNDIVLDSRPGKFCHLLNDRVDYHHDNLFGDINMVNGVPWPKMTVRPQHVRFKALNASPGRTYILKLLDDTGRNVAQDICAIVGSDGGYITTAKRFPAAGLLMGTAYRWDFVCDFSKFEGKSLHLTNQQNDAVNTGTPPFFCYSHLLMKIVVSSTLAPSVPINADLASNKAVMSPPYPKLNVFDTWPEDSARGPLRPEVLAALQKRANAGNVDRVISFVKSGGNWLMKDDTPVPSVSDRALGWDLEPADLPKDKRHLIFDDIGQNTVELWELKSGGGWIHPVHVHLIEFYVLRYNDGPVPDELSQVPKDVVQIGAAARRVIVAARFGPNYGKYMFHCHNGVHEDRDMLRAFLVTNATSGRTALTVMPGTAAFKNQGKNYVEGDASDSPNQAEYARPADETVAAAAKRYVDMSLYNAFYPVKGTAEELKILKDGAANPWLVRDICLA